MPPPLYEAWRTARGSCCCRQHDVALIGCRRYSTHSRAYRRSVWLAAHCSRCCRRLYCRWLSRWPRHCSHQLLPLLASVACVTLLCVAYCSMHSLVSLASIRSYRLPPLQALLACMLPLCLTCCSLLSKLSSAMPSSASQSLSSAVAFARIAGISQCGRSLLSLLSLAMLSLWLSRRPRHSSTITLIGCRRCLPCSRACRRSMWRTARCSRCCRRHAIALISCRHCLHRFCACCCSAWHAARRLLLLLLSLAMPSLWLLRRPRHSSIITLIGCHRCLPCSRACRRSTWRTARCSRCSRCCRRHAVSLSSAVAIAHIAFVRAAALLGVLLAARSSCCCRWLCRRRLSRHPRCLSHRLSSLLALLACVPWLYVACRSLISLLTFACRHSHWLFDVAQLTRVRTAALCGAPLTALAAVVDYTVVGFRVGLAVALISCRRCSPRSCACRRSTWCAARLSCC